MRAECFGQSRPQEGRQQTQNQDAFVIGRQPIPWMALCDGAGNAQRAVRSMVMSPFADLPAAVLDAAGRRGRADDMTVVALRLLRG